MRFIVFSIMVFLAACDSPSPPANSPAQPTVAPDTPSGTQDDDSRTSPNAIEPNEWVVNDAPLAPAPPIEDAFEAFLVASEEEQADIAFTMEPTRENAALVARLMSANISEDVKLGLLSAMEDSDYADILPALQIALLDPSPEVAIAAINILGDSERPDAVPLLQPLAESAVNEDVRAAAEDAIAALSL